MIRFAVENARVPWVIFASSSRNILWNGGLMGMSSGWYLHDPTFVESPLNIKVQGVVHVRVEWVDRLCQVIHHRHIGFQVAQEYTKL